MGGFTVQPSALTGFANVLCSSAASSPGLDFEFLTTAQDYCTEWVKLPGASGGLLFWAIVDTMGSLAGQLNGDYAVVSNIMVASANGLNQSAAQYRATDRATARHLDSIYNRGSTTPSDAGIDVSSPSADPASKLTTPKDDGAVPDPVQQVLDGIGYFSETELVLKILSLFGLNVEDWVKQRLAGDYKRLAQCRNSIKNLEDFENTTATALAEGLAKMLGSWQGNAADAAKSYFDQFAQDLTAHAGTLSSIAQKLDALVVAMQQSGSALIGALTIAIDRGIEVGISLAAAGFLQEVPGVNVIADIVGAWKVTELINKIHELATIWAKVWTVLQAALSGIVTLVGSLQNYSSHMTLPSAAYANASQGLQPGSNSMGTGSRRGPQ
ncbi:MAG TPA: WXG100 family type VII secretion target [Pseudonocardiaceae bacterium]